MDLYYYRDFRGWNNFGDDLNKWFWPKVIGEYLKNNDQFVFVGFGTLINEYLSVRLAGFKEKIIFGTGVGYGSSLPVLDSSWHILFVRGPLSAKKLGLSSRDAITDSAMLIRNFYSKANGNLIGFMPHVSQDVQGNFHWRKLCKKLGYLYISPQAEVATVLAQIRSCKLLLSEAMHGAIVADALRVPWIPLASSDVLPFKWLDWCQSLELPYHPIKIPSFWTSKTPLSKVKNCIKFRLAEQSFHRAVTHGPYQSKEHILDDKINQINARLLTIKSLL